ncbi:hypothetical protein HSBAA_57490 [Vreelandella sulfidaeris]|uniref:TRAP transporter small permease protein n=1 Tax=Vreelandella sulfidaeris TaxID=115553 RepID=A0A455UGE9_9GAMM|nr:hypothetical protein HSBAA_57490 [Halomonas sulfidaeris]
MLSIRCAAFTRLCDGVGVALMAAILLLIVAAVIARDLLGLGMPWTEEVASMLAIYAIGFGSLSAWVRSEHLVVDLFSHKLSGLGKNIQYRLTALISCGFLHWPPGGLDHVRYER